MKTTKKTTAKKVSPKTTKKVATKSKTKVETKDYGKQSKPIIIELSDRKQIRVTKIEKSAKIYFDVRGFWLDTNTDEFMPGKGIWIPKTALKEVLSAIKKASA